MKLMFAGCFFVFSAAAALLQAADLEKARPSAGETSGKSVFRIPEPALNYLKTLTDDRGIFEHAAYNIPDRKHGYCAEDAGRALAAVLMFNRRKQGDKDAVALAQTYMAYLYHSQVDDGNFHHRMDFQGRLSPEMVTEDAYGRVLWGLGYGAAYPADDGMGSLARAMFKKALPLAKDLKWPRAMAYAMTGLYYYLERYPQSLEVEEIMNALAAKLTRFYEENSSADWQWFENTATYDNARLPQALLLAYGRTGKKEYLKTALKTLDFLIDVNFRDGNMMQVIGNRGWYAKGQKPALYDQQPIDAAAMVEACAMAYQMSGLEKYKKKMKMAFEWFLGKNTAGKPLYDSTSGGSRDGINEDKINENQGAESSIMFVIAHLTLLGVL